MRRLPGQLRRRGADKGTYGQIDEGRIRRIAWQLALVTGITISVLLATLGITVFKSTQNALFDVVRNSVVTRARNEASQQQRQLMSAPSPGSRISGQPPGPTGGPGRSEQPPREGVGHEPPNGDAVYLTVLKRNWTCITSTPGGPNGADGKKIPSPRLVRNVFQTGKAELATIVYDKTPYLTYTEPVLAPRRPGRVLAVVQSSASESPYKADVNSLVRVLLLVGGIGLLAALLITGMVVYRALLPIRISLRRQRDFVADAAHELRTPISIIRTAGEMLLRDSSGEKREEMAKATVEEASHLTRLVADLSLLARSDTGTLDFEKTTVNVSALVKSVVGDIDVLAEERGVNLHLETGKEIFVLGDSMRLRQLFLVLLDNALKHTPAGGTVEVLLDTAKRRARLRVIDSGPGIAAGELNQVFDRFFRSGAARSGEGTGLGLAIADSIVRAHHGAISAANQAAGGGAVFTVILPLASVSKGESGAQIAAHQTA